MTNNSSDITLTEQQINRVVNSIEKIADSLCNNKHEKPVQLTLFKKILNVFKSKYLWSIVLAGLALYGYWLNWRADITNIKVNRIEKKITEKQLLQKQLTKAVAVARATILNQMELCPKSNKSQEELKTERNNSIVDPIALGAGIGSIYGKKVEHKLDQILVSMYQIKDVCSLNPKNTDLKYQRLSSQLTNLINTNIEKDYQKLDQIQNQSTYDALLSTFTRGFR